MFEVLLIVCILSPDGVRCLEGASRGTMPEAECKAAVRADMIDLSESLLLQGIMAQVYGRCRIKGEDV